MKAHTLIAAAYIISASEYHLSDATISPDPWVRSTTYKGSGTGNTGLNIKKSRAKAKAARKARKKHKAGK